MSELFCTGCGSRMTDDQLAAEQAHNPVLRSCCPERDMQPHTPPAPTLAELNDLMDRVICNTAKELGCIPDNEVILQTIAGMKDALAAKDAEIARLKELIDQAAIWHEAEAKALSKSGRKDTEAQWRRMQHREQIDELRAALTPRQSDPQPQEGKSDV